MFTVNDISIPLGTEREVTCRSLEIKDGLWALVGRNGAGKSTFLSALIGQRNISDGKVFWKDQSVFDLPLSEKSKQISIVYTKPDIFGNYTVRDVIGLGRLPYQNIFGTNSKDDEQAINHALEMLNLNSFENRLFNALSDGEKQLVMIGRALAQDTQCVILDEPTAFLDIVNRRYIIKTLNRIVEQTGKLIIFSTHDVELISKYCNGLIWISEGRIEHSTDKAFFDERIKQLFGYEV